MATYYPIKRLYEWVSTCILASIGLALAIPGDTMTGPLFAPLLEVGSESFWTVGLIVIAAIRACALVINGFSPKGSPAVRAVAATLTAVIFATLVASFVAAGQVGLWAASVYLVLACTEILIVYRATLELKNAIDCSS